MEDLFNQGLANLGAQTPTPTVPQDPAFGGTPAPAPTPTVPPATPAPAAPAPTPAPAGAQPAPGTPTQPVTPNNDDKGNTVKQLRDQYNATKQEVETLKVKDQKNAALLQRIAAQRNISVEELEAKLQEEEDKKLAAQNQVPVEYQRQLREQGEQIKQLQQERVRLDFNIRAQKLQNEAHLDIDGMRNFAQQARTAGFDITQPGTDLVALYRALNYDTVVNSMKDQIRQQVLQEIQQNRTTAPQPNNIAGRAPLTPVNSSDDNAAFLNEVFNKLK